MKKVMRKIIDFLKEEGTAINGYQERMLEYITDNRNWTRRDDIIMEVLKGISQQEGMTEVLEKDLGDLNSKGLIYEVNTKNVHYCTVPFDELLLKVALKKGKEAKEWAEDAAEEIGEWIGKAGESFGKVSKEVEGFFGNFAKTVKDILDDEEQTEKK